METVYLSTFVTGFNSVARPALLKAVKDAQIELELDGLIIYRTSANINQIRQLRFTNNSFIVLNQVKVRPSNPLHHVMQEALNIDIKPILLATLPHRPTTFRVKTFIENKPVSTNRSLFEKLQKQITHTPFLHLNKSRAQFEFWCFTRKEGYGFYAIKITRSPNYEKTLHRGELRPELANLLCLMSEPQAKDVFLDPFAGYGSIPQERAKIMPSSQIIASDSNALLVNELQAKAINAQQPVTVKEMDATHLDLPDLSITKIVTDPPWGIFEMNINIGQLYKNTLFEFDRVLKSSGIIVILTGQPELLRRLLEDNPTLAVAAEYSTLVSGKKATAFKIIKSRSNNDKTM